MATSDHQSNNSGFILGLLTGAVITLFLTTKKGRDLLHTVTDESSDLFAELEDLLSEKVSETKEKVEKALPHVEKNVEDLTANVQEEVSKIVENMSDTIQKTIHEKVDKTIKTALEKASQSDVGQTVEHEFKKLELIDRAQDGVKNVEKTMDEVKERLQSMEDKIMEMPEVKKAAKSSKRFFKRRSKSA